MKKSRRKFTAKFKAMVAIESLKGNHPAKYILTKGIEAAYLANRYTSLL